MSAYKRILMARLSQTPPIQLSNPASWNDLRAKAKRYASVQAFIDFAECWARLMQVHLARGKKLEEVWQTTRNEACYMQLRDRQILTAMGFLVVCWVHGPELMRVLHNTGWNIGLASDMRIPGLPHYMTE